MDNVQLRYVLDFRRCERLHVGICIINARDRLILVCNLVLLPYATDYG
jgi:hypothetical protein